MLIMQLLVLVPLSTLLRSHADLYLFCCSNVSSDGEYARNKLRDCPGLVDCVVTVVQSSVFIVEMDSKAIENCVCVMRNLSYACQEVDDPGYLARREAKSAAHDGTVSHF